jgi:hypothetical protein
MAEQPIGPVLDGLGITVDLDDGALLETALVVAKVVTLDGTVVIGLYSPTGMTWFDQYALICAAKAISNDQPWRDLDE